MLEAIKGQMEASDEEWEKISPKIEKLLDAKHNLSTGAGMSWSSQNGAAAVFKPSNANVDTPAGKAMQEVRAALEDKETPADEITRKLAALQEAIEKARAELATARQELKDALTPRQLAILATLGVME